MGHSTVLYQAINQLNGKRYIGITSAGLPKRERRHRTWAKHGYGAAIGNALRKYGVDIKFSVLAVCPNLEYAKEMEVAAVAAFSPEYNVTKGGDGCNGYKHTDEHKKRMSQRQSGNKHWLGKRHSPETIQKMRQSAGKHRRRAVISVVDGIKFESLSAAARNYGITTTYVYDLCKTGRKSSDGCQFTYASQSNRSTAQPTPPIQGA